MQNFEAEGVACRQSIGAAHPCISSAGKAGRSLKERRTETQSSERYESSNGEDLSAGWNLGFKVQRGFEGFERV